MWSVLLWKKQDLVILVFITKVAGKNVLVLFVWLLFTIKGVLKIKENIVFFIGRRKKMIRAIGGGTFEGIVYKDNNNSKEKEVAAAAVAKYEKDKSKLLKAELIKIIEDIIPMIK